MVGSWGLEPQTSTVSIPRRVTHNEATGSSEAHRKHHDASVIWCEESVGYGTNYVTISGDCVQYFLFRRLADRWAVAQEKLLRRRAVCPSTR